MMKAMMCKEFNRPLELVEIEKPRIKPYEILLKVAACGLCQTDLKILGGKIPSEFVKLPVVPGHEVVGEVVSIGEKVSGVKIGDVGAVYLCIFCRECQYCLEGRQNLCLNLHRVGFDLQGGMAEYLKIPAHAFCPFQKGLPMEKMAIIADAIGTPYHAITRFADVKAGYNLCIVGAGGLGLHAIQIAKLYGAKVFVVDLDPKALSLAQELGADEILQPDQASEAIRDHTSGLGVDAVIEIVGSPQTFSWSLPTLKRGGKLIIVGYIPGQSVALDAMDMHFHEWQVIGSRFVTKPELMKVIKLIEEGKIKPVVTKTYPFEQANDALKALQSKTVLGRTVLTF
jgi:2-desacetyl-2-hydroxyethyl bacteriochlorophyllide A dehydrogenase